MRLSFLLALWLLVLSSLDAAAQHTVLLSVKHAEEKTPLAGATAQISSLQRSASADSLGIITFTGLPEGSYTISISYVGLEPAEVTITLPRADEGPVEVWLGEGEEHEEEVIVTATRISRSISDLPTRVETISGEELAEKGNMKPGDIRMLLNESTGIQTQQTSATSYNSSIRIQGLDGRYTQLLRDGLPLYAGFSGGLSLMQLTPLDLRQVEVIKGSSSTLYGGGAIAGLVNLVSKIPGKERELSFLTNATTAGGLDLSGFYSQRFSSVGLTVFGSRNTSRAYDPAGIGLTAIPRFDRYTLHPRIFFYGQRTSANAGFSYITEKRTGGSMEYIRNGTAGYFEKNSTDRITGQAEVLHQLSESKNLQLKSSFTRFNRQIALPAYLFEGLQRSSYTELNFSSRGERSDLIAGLNFITDDFNEERQNTALLRNYQYNTIGVFVQHTWRPTGKFSLETGLRGDRVEEYGFEWLPRLSAMLKITPQLVARLGGGLGYKTPTVFNEESERMHFRGILPMEEQMARNERSAGGNLDLNYRTNIGAVGFSVNHLFFYTRLNRPLVLTPLPGDTYAFVNANGYLDTKGMETNLRFTYEDFKLFIGYTYADVNTHFDGVKSWFPLTARHRLNNVLMYEKEDNLKIGLEAYFFSPQRLSDGAVGKSYWISGLMAEKIWERFSLFVNFENIFDARQTRFDTIYTGNINDPKFRDIYAPVDGFVINGGIKIRL